MHTFTLLSFALLVECTIAPTPEQNQKREEEAAKASEIIRAYADCIFQASRMTWPKNPTDANVAAASQAQKDNYKALEAFYSTAPDDKKPPKLDAVLKTKLEDCVYQEVESVGYKIDKTKIEGLLRLNHHSTSFASSTEPTYSNQGEFKQAFDKNWEKLSLYDKYLQKLVPRLDEAFPPSTDQCWNSIDTKKINKAVCDINDVMNAEVVKKLFECIANTASPNTKTADLSDVKKIAKVIKWGIDFMYCDKYRKGNIGLNPSMGTHFLVEQNILSIGGVAGKIWKGIFITYWSTFFFSYEEAKEKIDEKVRLTAIPSCVSKIGGVIVGIVGAGIFGSIFAAVQFIVWVLATFFYAAPKVLVQLVWKFVEECLT